MNFDTNPPALFRYKMKLSKFYIMVSGFHWIWDVTTMLINNTSRISKELPGKYSLELGVRKMEQIPPPRVLGSHLYYEELPASIRQKKCKIIYVIRDPRAVAVSSYHFFTKIKESKWNGTWTGYLNLSLNGKGKKNNHFHSNIQQL